MPLATAAEDPGTMWVRGPGSRALRGGSDQFLLHGCHRLRLQGERSTLYTCWERRANSSLLAPFLTLLRGSTYPPGRTCAETALKTE